MSNNTVTKIRRLLLTTTLLMNGLATVSFAQPVHVTAVTHVQSEMICPSNCKFRGLSVSSTGEILVTFLNWKNDEVVVADANGVRQQTWLSAANAERPRHLKSGGDYIGLDLTDQIVLENNSGERVRAAIPKRYLLAEKKYLEDRYPDNKNRPFNFVGMDRKRNAYGVLTDRGTPYIWTFDPGTRKTTMRLAPYGRPARLLCGDSESSILLMRSGREYTNDTGDVIHISDLLVWEKTNRKNPVFRRMHRVATNVWNGPYSESTVNVKCGKSMLGSYLVAENYFWNFTWEFETDTRVWYRDEVSINPKFERLSFNTVDPSYSLGDTILIKDITRSGMTRHTNWENCGFITKDHARSSEKPVLKEFKLGTNRCDAAIEHGDSLYVVTKHLVRENTDISGIQLHQYALEQKSLSEIVNTLNNCRHCVVKTAQDANRSVQVVRMLDKFGESVTQQSIDYLGERLIRRIGWKRSQLLISQAGTILGDLSTGQSRALLWNLYQTKHNDFSRRERGSRSRGVASRNNLDWDVVKTWIRYL